MNRALGPTSHDGDDSDDQLLSHVLERTSGATVTELPSIIARTAEVAGIHDLVLYLTDYEQRHLIPLQGADVASREALVVDQTFGGRAFRSIEILSSDNDEGGVRVWLPLMHGSVRLGIVEATVADLDAAMTARCQKLARLVAMVLMTTDLYTDVLTLARRTKGLSLAAEMQWSLLPPLAFSDSRVTVSGSLEPSYQIAGDTFDYALNDGIAHIAIIDAMGHGFEAAVMASVAVNVYRHSRRHGLDLVETYDAMDRAVADQFGEGKFATAHLVQLHADTGLLHWLNAGHPPPLLIRGRSVIGPADCSPSLPLGLGGTVEEIAEISLEPGDRLMLMSDGVLEARSTDGQFFGEGPLPDFLGRALATGLPGPEILRRLSHAILEHHASQLDDDATTVMIEWAGNGR